MASHVVHPGCRVGSMLSWSREDTKFRSVSVLRPCSRYCRLQTIGPGGGIFGKWKILCFQYLVNTELKHISTYLGFSGSCFCRRIYSKFGCSLSYFKQSAWTRMEESWLPVLPQSCREMRVFSFLAYGA